MKHTQNFPYEPIKSGRIVLKHSNYGNRMSIEILVGDIVNPVIGIHLDELDCLLELLTEAKRMWTV